MPPRIPPALFEEKPVFRISSLISEPLRAKISSAFPIETDFTALMLMIALAKSASSLSNTGSPNPIGQFLTLTPSLAPTELPSEINSENILFKSSNLVSSAKKYLFVFGEFRLI